MPHFLARPPRGNRARLHAKYIDGSQPKETASIFMAAIFFAALSAGRVYCKTQAVYYIQCSIRRNCHSITPKLRVEKLDAAVQFIPGFSDKEWNLYLLF